MDAGLSTEGLRVTLIRGPEGKAQFSALLDQGFQIPAGSHFFNDFPIWDESLAPVNQTLRIGIFHHETLVACAGLRMAGLKANGGGVLPIGMIGAVATHESWRGRSLATQLVSYLVDHAKKQGAAITMLWGSEHSLYEKLGFQLCGTQVRIPLMTLDLGQGPAPGARIGMGWNPALLGCMQRRTAGLALSQNDLLWLSSHKNVHWLWSGNPASPSAYLAVNRGIDLFGMVHEWGGEWNELAELLACVRKVQPEAELLGSPLTYANYPVLDAAQASMPREFLCMGKVVDPLKAIKALKPELLEAVARIDPSTFDASTLFGHHEAAIPLWIWGLDAV